MSDFLATFLAVYVSVLFIKTYYLLKVYPHAVAGVVRAHWRVTGSVTKKYFASVAFGIATVGAVIAMLWPLLLFVEGRRVLHPYNAFGVTRSSMRGVLASHDQ